ncbi:F0F1 ATP synthase subunit A [Mycoplasma wenyonii]|uniref:F0F1 ATP synthase subunit A n=2 Tax=Mycoplasma wenyonii TaxID=65123 RepID=A0A328PUL7_9MOLU|nr:F0F1 ATP synthase subunit A [Mycoplasma wenyonii]
MLFFQQTNGDDANKVNSVISGAFMVTVLILFLGLYYKITLERAKNYKKLPKIIFLVFLMIRWIKRTTIEMLGRRYSFAIPFFIYIVFYFWGTSLVGMLGFQGISTFAYIPMSIAGVVFVGTVFSGLAAKGWGFCKDYYVWFRLGKKKILPIPDVLKMLGEAGKVISLGLRLWGNYFAGAIVLFMVKHFLSSSIGTSWQSNITTQSFLFPLHLYFDVVDGALHSMIFLILTLSYWSMAKQVESK